MKVEIEISEDEIREAIVQWMDHNSYKDVMFAGLNAEDIIFTTVDQGSLGVHTKAVARIDTNG